MIKTIWSGDSYVLATGGTEGLPYVATNINNPMQGMLRINGNSLDVFDGSSWRSVGGGSASISLTARAQDIMKWAEEKMQRELEIKEAIKDSPTVADAYQTYKDAEEKLLIVMALTDKGEDK